MNEREIKYENVLKEFSEKLPKFSDGRVNYSDSDKAPALICFIKYNDKILLLKRSDKVLTYRGLWNTVAGYLDELRPLEEKVYLELEEEVGITKEMIKKIRLGNPYEFIDNDIRKTWIIFPAIVELKKESNVRLDWEHTDYKWIKPFELKDHKIVPNLAVTLSKVL